MYDDWFRVLGLHAFLLFFVCLNACLSAAGWVAWPQNRANGFEQAFWALSVLFVRFERHPGSNTRLLIDSSVLG